MHELNLELAADPVALVSDAEARAAFAQQVAQQVAGLPYMLAGPVTLRVSCPTRPVGADGLVEYPNLAMWLAPLLEAFTGAGRLLLSKAQVTDIQVVTAAPSDPPARLSVTVIHRPDQRLPRTDAPLPGQPRRWPGHTPRTSVTSWTPQSSTTATATPTGS
jgi:hypothetical protein